VAREKRTNGADGPVQRETISKSEICHQNPSIRLRTVDRGDTWSSIALLNRDFGKATLLCDRQKLRSVLHQVGQNANVSIKPRFRN
jgi:hypothetical protein